MFRQQGRIGPIPTAAVAVACAFGAVCFAPPALAERCAGATTSHGTVDHRDAGEIRVALSTGSGNGNGNGNIGSNNGNNNGNGNTGAGNGNGNGNAGSGNGNGNGNGHK